NITFASPRPLATPSSVRFDQGCRGVTAVPAQRRAGCPRDHSTLGSLSGWRGPLMQAAFARMRRGSIGLDENKKDVNIYIYQYFMPLTSRENSGPIRNLVLHKSDKPSLR